LLIIITVGEASVNVSLSINKIMNKPRGAEKIAKIPVSTETLRKPAWIRTKVPLGANIHQLKTKLRQHHLHTVCEEAACPNLGECFAAGTATFMIMGNICTRRCPFCEVAHGHPLPLDPDEPLNLAKATSQLNYVVITSVNRDDLRDGGASHFAACIQSLHHHSPHLKIEVLVPDFRGRLEVALAAFQQAPPEVFNHNLETVPRLYKQVRPGADYSWSLQLLQRFKAQHPSLPTKSGLMLGLGETLSEVEATMQDLRAHDCDWLTLGQYLQPSRYHLPVSRYVTPAEFEELAQLGQSLGFQKVTSGPLVRSSYHAEIQAHDVL